MLDIPVYCVKMAAEPVVSQLGGVVDCRSMNHVLDGVQIPHGHGNEAHLRGRSVCLNFVHLF